ncbi:MAG: cysteine desulfurase-like protein [Candidatus Dormibacteria bacterium]
MPAADSGLNRHRFPGLRDGWCRLDGPGGSLPVDTAIDAMADWMASGRGANTQGAFAAAQETDAAVGRARSAVGRLLGADPAGVVFGPSMTGLTLRLADAVAATLQPGDEIVCTRLDHDANVSPWLLAAERSGALVRFAEPDPDSLELAVADVEKVLSERTRWLAVTAASNACGSIPDVTTITARAHLAGARVAVDAVHAAPHYRLDATTIGCDVLLCSAYKWFGPHLGVMAATPQLLELLTPAKIRPAPDRGAGRWEVGTLPFELLEGAGAAAEYLLETGFDAVVEQEAMLRNRMLDGLRAIDGVTLHGSPVRRTPTLLFSLAGVSAEQVAVGLARRRVAVWDGDFYAVELLRLLGLPAAVRAGALHYNDAEDVERLVSGVREIAAGG